MGTSESVVKLAHSDVNSTESDNRTPISNEEEVLNDMIEASR